MARAGEGDIRAVTLSSAGTLDVKLSGEHQTALSQSDMIACKGPPQAWCGDRRAAPRSAAGPARCWRVAAEGLRMAGLGTSGVAETGCAAWFSVACEEL